MARLKGKSTGNPFLPRPGSEDVTQLTNDELRELEAIEREMREGAATLQHPPLKGEFKSARGERSTAKIGKEIRRLLSLGNRRRQLLDIAATRAKQSEGELIERPPTEMREGQGESMPREKQQAQYPSRRPGYEQPSRKDKVGIKVLVRKQMRKNFRTTAKEANLTSEELLEYLVVSAVHRAEADALFREELAEEGKRVAETKRLAKEAAQNAAAQAKRSITETRNASRPVSRRLGPKNILG